MVIAVPVGIGVAIFLTELCPPVLRRPIGIAIELLAGIPSIIYGMWGFFVLAPVPADVAARRSGLSLFTLFAGAQRHRHLPPLILASWCCPSSPPSPATCSRPCRRC